MARRQLKSTEPVVFKEIESGTNQIIRIHRTVFRGRELLSIQKFWREDEHQDWQFGKAVTMHYEDIDDIIDGLEKMKEWCEENISE